MINRAMLLEGRLCAAQVYDTDPFALPASKRVRTRRPAERMWGGGETPGKAFLFFLEGGE